MKPTVFRFNEDSLTFMGENVRRFVLNRRKDISGVSGVGVVADGVAFEDGRVVLHWRGRWRTMELLQSIQEVLDIHGHDGASTIEWLDTLPSKPPDYGEA